MRSLLEYIRRLFRKDRFADSNQEIDVASNKYSLTVTQLFQEGVYKEFSLRKACGPNRWKGNVLSLTDAYTFLLMLPEVRAHTVEKHWQADSIAYTVHLSVTDIWKLSTLSLRTRNYVKLEFLISDYVLLEIRLLIHNK